MKTSLPDVMHMQLHYKLLWMYVMLIELFHNKCQDNNITKCNPSNVSFTKLSTVGHPDLAPRPLACIRILNTWRTRPKRQAQKDRKREEWTLTVHFETSILESDKQNTNPHAAGNTCVQSKIIYLLTNIILPHPIASFTPTRSMRHVYIVNCL